MKKDIENRTDIVLLVNIFYERIIADQKLGYIFQHIAQVYRDAHLQAMYEFWENIILFSGKYQGNPMNVHRHLHHIIPLNAAHFYHWNQLFVCTVNDLFEGEKANLAKQRAVSISGIIKEKILDYQQKNN